MGRSALIWAILSTAIVFGAFTTSAQQKADPRVADIVRAGKLRVALGLGTPALALKNPPSGEVRGPALDLGRALAARIGVNVQSIEYASPGAVIEGVGTDAWDVTFFVVDPNRATAVDFSPPYMQGDFTYLVSGGSPMRTVADVDQQGVRVAVAHGDAADLRLSKTLKRAELVRTETLAAGLDLVRTGEAEAFAAPRAVLSGLADRVPASRILDGSFAVSDYAASVPKGHAGRLAYVSEFIEEAKASGLIKQLIERYGLQGVQVAPPGNPPSQ